MSSFIAMAVVGGLVLGWLTGRRFQRAHRAWFEYRTTKNSLATLRTVAWALTRPAAGFVVLVIVVAGYALYMTTQSN
ncbi:MAG: hypothetical protein ACRDUA_11505 [Micromonosporaceae bacterium]